MAVDDLATGLGATATVFLPGGESEFRRLLESLPLAAYTCDPDGLITYFNPAAERLWGRAPKLNDPIDRYCGSFKLFSALGQSIPHSQCWMALALQDNDGFNGREIVAERPDGSRLTALAYANPVRDETGKLRGAVNVLVDITARKLGEQDLIAIKNELATQLGDLRRLHEMSVRLSTTLELSPILNETLATAAAVSQSDMGMIALCDGEQQNLAVGASMGLDDAVVKSFDRIPPAAASGMCFEQRRRIIVEDTESDAQFAEYREASLRAGIRAVHCTPLVTRGGKMLGVLTMYFRRPHRPTDRQIHVIDLCARQAVDFIENARLYQRLKDADRAKDEFLATLAHELRNPLAPVMNALQIVRSNDSSTPQGKWAIEVMERQMQQMTRLVDDLLDVSRITRNKLELRKERIDLAAVINIAVETSRPQIDLFEHELEVIAPGEPLHLIGDATRLAQAISNLLNNAAKYTPPRGKVRLSVERAANEAVIRVRDNGIGIAPEMLPRIFDMFMQADRADASAGGSGGGLGVGLTLVKRLVELHGGTIEARSDGPGKGSEFVIRVPVSASSAPRPMQAVDRLLGNLPGSPRVLRVLVVDDNRDSALSLSMLLRMKGNDVRTAYDGVEAVQVAEQFHPDVILADIGMPRLNGYDAARKIRQQPWSKSATLIAISGWGQETDKALSREAGFDQHLVKPIDPQALIAMLASLPRPAAD